MIKLIILITSLFLASPCLAVDIKDLDQVYNPFINNFDYVHNLGSIGEDLIPSISDTYDIGSSTYWWKDLYLAGSLNVDDHTFSMGVDGVEASAVDFNVFTKTSGAYFNINGYTGTPAVNITNLKLDIAQAITTSATNQSIFINKDITGVGDGTAYTSDAIKIDFDITRTITGTQPDSTMTNRGLFLDFDWNAADSVDWQDGSIYGYCAWLDLRRQGQITGVQYPVRYYGLKINVDDDGTYNNGAGTYAVTGDGIEIDLSSNGTVTADSSTKVLKGLNIDNVTATTVGTSSRAYGIYIDNITADTTWAIFNNSNDDIFMGDDEVYTRWGSVQDVSCNFDGGTFEWQSDTASYDWEFISFNTIDTGGANVENDADSSYIAWGAADDYKITFNGANAVHTVTSGRYYFLQNGMSIQEGSGFALSIGADVNAYTLTDNTRKYVRFGMPHYDNDEQNVSLITGDSDNGVSYVSIGGGTSAGNAAEVLRFYTATNDITTTGSIRLEIDNVGDVDFKAGNLTTTGNISTTGGDFIGSGTASPALSLTSSGGRNIVISATDSGFFSHIGTISNHGLLVIANNTEWARLNATGELLLNTAYTDTESQLVVRRDANYEGMALKATAGPRIFFDEGTGGSETEVAFFGIQLTNDAFVMRQFTGSGTDVLFAVQSGGGRAVKDAEPFIFYHNGALTMAGGGALTTTGDIHINSDTSDLIVGTEGTLSMGAGSYDASGDNLEFTSTKDACAVIFKGNDTQIRFAADRVLHGAGYFQAGSVTGGVEDNGYLYFSGYNGAVATSVNFKSPLTTFADTTGACSGYFQGSAARLRFVSSGAATYIQSGNSAFNANVPLNFTGYNGNQGSTCNIKFAATTIGDGGTTNYASFAADGELTLAGTARAWKSEDLTPANTGLPNTDPPELDDYLGFQFHRYDDGGVRDDEQVFFLWHVPCDYAATTASVRGHFGLMVDSPPTNPDGNEIVSMGFQYTKISDGVVFAVAPDGGGSIDETIVEDETAYTWHETATGVCDTTGWVAGDIILFRFFRDTSGVYSANDDCDSDAWVGGYHLEYLRDKLGEAST